MNYRRIYNEIIENRRKHPIDGYGERHHIEPRCLGGSDDDENVVKLSAREHFICHFILTKLYERDSVEHLKMLIAFSMMKCSSVTHNRYFNSRLYDSLRNDFVKAMSVVMKDKQTGTKNSQYGTQWIHSFELKKCKKIPKNESIPEGWSLGRIMCFDKLEKKKQHDLEKNLKKERQKQERFEKLKMLHEIYVEFGWKSFVKITGYDKSQPNLVKTFSSKLNNFVTQQGKKR